MSSDESSSGSESDSGFEQDMEALRKACSFTSKSSPNPNPDPDYNDSDNSDSDSEPNEDVELLRSLQKRFPVSMKPLQTILPDPENGDDDDDYDFGGDFETLRAIQRRLLQYEEDSMNIMSMESGVQKAEQVGATNNIDLGKESSPNFFVKRCSNNNGRGFPDCVDERAVKEKSLDVSSSITPSTPSASEGREPGSELVSVTDGSFPKSARTFVEAIKKNRMCQKLIRDKIAQIGARVEEIRKLKERVKIMKDYQTACRKRTGRALSQKKDARVQLISIPKQRANASKMKDKHVNAINTGPAENTHVEHYRAAVSKYPFSLSREPWSKDEKKNLLKGIRQQFQEMLTRNLLSGGDGGSCYRVNMIEKIKDYKITHKELKSFLESHKVNWERLASIYVKGRSGPECESRWRNCEDPLINHEPWTSNEDKKLLHIVSNRGISNWIEIATELKTNRTPFRCLSRFQRSLNASIIKTEWTPSDDDELRKAVAEYGDTNWQLVASAVEGRTGTQCSNRWKKSLNPRRKVVGRWVPDEDKRLKIAVRLFGAKNWNKIAKFVPGRTQEQLRERWVNCLDPRLNMKEWTEDEDLKLEKLSKEYNYCWSRVAASIPPRTDNQCRRRWKVLFPDQVRTLQVAKKLKKAAFISNFVDREGERPNLTVNDFIATLPIESDPKAIEGRKTLNKKKQRSRRARKITRTKKVFKPNDEGDVAEKDGHADNTTNTVGPATFDVDIPETKKQVTGKLKFKERAVPKIRSRRARLVSHTEKALRLIDEEDVEYEGHPGILDKVDVEKSRAVDVDDDREIKRKATGKQKRKQNQRDEETVGGMVKTESKEKSIIDCGFDDERRPINSSSTELKVYVRRRFRKHNIERCGSSSNRKTSEMLEDEETLGSFMNKFSSRKKSEELLEDEETLGSFLNKFSNRKKSEELLEEEETLGRFFNKLKKKRRMLEN